MGKHDLELVVVAGVGPCLMGIDWLETIRLDLPSIGAISQTKGKAKDQVRNILNAEGLGTIKKFKATSAVDKDAMPRFHRPRPVSFL